MQTSACRMDSLRAYTCVQVSQLESGLLILTLLIALGFGTYCMGILDTPTRFATPKDHDR